MQAASFEKKTQSLLRAEDVARALNISLALAYRLLQRGEIRSVRIGTAVRVRPEDLAAYIEDNLYGQGLG